MNLNKIFLIGNLTRDPELRTLPSGKPVVNFGIATNRTWKNQTGEKQQDTQFHNIVMFGRLAEIAKQYLTKGGLVMVEGRIQTRSWDAQDGSKRYSTEIIAESMQLGPRRVGYSDETPTEQGSLNGSRSSSKEEKLDTIEYPDENINPDEIPF